MNAVPFDAELTVAHIIDRDEPLPCPRGVPIFEPANKASYYYAPNRPNVGTVLRVYRCALPPGHNGECEPDYSPWKCVTVCGETVTGTWINWPSGEAAPCPACHGVEPDPTLL